MTFDEWKALPNVHYRFNFLELPLWVWIGVVLGFIALVIVWGIILKSKPPKS